LAVEGLQTALEMNDFARQQRELELLEQVVGLAQGYVEVDSFDCHVGRRGPRIEGPVGGNLRPCFASCLIGNDSERDTVVVRTSRESDEKGDLDQNTADTAVHPAAYQQRNLTAVVTAAVTAAVTAVVNEVVNEVGKVRTVLIVCQSHYEQALADMAECA